MTIAVERLQFRVDSCNVIFVTIVILIKTLVEKYIIRVRRFIYGALRTTSVLYETQTLCAIINFRQQNSNLTKIALKVKSQGQI